MVVWAKYGCTEFATQICFGAFGTNSIANYSLKKMSVFQGKVFVGKKVGNQKN